MRLTLTAATSNLRRSLATLHKPAIPALLAGLLLAGCTTPTPERPAVTGHLSCKVPVLVPVEPDKQDQARDGIRISVAGYTYEPKVSYRRMYRRVPSLLVVNHEYPVEVRQIPSVSVYPKEVRFKVKVYNQLERVLRLAGSVVSFQAGGKALAVDRARYDNFLQGIILPRQEAEYEVAGPDISALPPNATLALFLYDIVTATDPAGNPTKRSNFEFYYQMKEETKTAEAHTSIQKTHVNQEDNQMLLRRASLGEWVPCPELDARNGSAEGGTGR